MTPSPYAAYGYREVLFASFSSALLGPIFGAMLGAILAQLLGMATERQLEGTAIFAMFALPPLIAALWSVLALRTARQRGAFLTGVFLLALSPLVIPTLRLGASLFGMGAVWLLFVVPFVVLVPAALAARALALRLTKTR